MLRIVADENILFAEKAFSTLGEVTLLPGRKIAHHHLKHADILLVRSVTQVTHALLRNTPVQFVGTATIGTDHVDTADLAEAGIAFASAAGCNADAVAEYVLTAMAHIAVQKGIALPGSKIGIVGVGNIGGRVRRLARALDMEVLLNDPPLKRLTGNSEYLALDALLDTDFLSLHVPLNMAGEDKTWHLFDSRQLEKLHKDIVLINTSRGPLIDNSALTTWAKNHSDASIVLDVWENEPEISADLLAHVDLGTPHIAGYSLEGKINGTYLIYKALCRYLNRSPVWQPELPAPENEIVKVRGDTGIEHALFETTSKAYAITKDDANLRKLPGLPKPEQPVYFDSLRKKYVLRREFCNYTIRLAPMDSNIAHALSVFRFSIPG
ncbi:MAG: 4-phosphoerythronate dehydrogenase [bacterium]